MTLADVKEAADAARIAAEESHAVLSEIMSKFEELSADLKPTIDQILNHPMVKMMGGGKR